MAAKELKKRTWLLNKKHLVWFKIHDKGRSAQEYLIFNKEKWKVMKSNNLECHPSLILYDI